MNLLRQSQLLNQRQAEFGILPFLGKGAAQTAATGATKMGLGQKLMNGFNAFNAVTMPLFLAPLFVPDATTRLQSKMQQQQLKNPWLATSMKNAQQAAQQAANTGGDVVKTLTNNGVMTANPASNQIVTNGLPKNSLL